MTDFQVEEPRPAIGSTSRSGSGKRTASPRMPSRIRSLKVPMPVPAMFACVAGVITADTALLGVQPSP